MGKRYVKVYDGDESTVLMKNKFVALLDGYFKEDNYSVNVEYYKFRGTKEKTLYPIESEEVNDEFDAKNDKAIIFWNLYWFYRAEEQKKELTQKIKKMINDGAKIYIIVYCSSPDFSARTHFKLLKDLFGEDYVEDDYEVFMATEYFGEAMAEIFYDKLKYLFDNKLAFDDESMSNKPASLEMKPNQSAQGL